MSDCIVHGWQSAQEVCPQCKVERTTTRADFEAAVAAMRQACINRCERLYAKNVHCSEVELCIGAIKAVPVDDSHLRLQIAQAVAATLNKIESDMVHHASSYEEAITYLSAMTVGANAEVERLKKAVEG